MEKVLVTGGAGFVGSTLVGMLLKKGYYVRVIDNLMYSGEGLMEYIRNYNFEFINGDITDINNARTAVEGMDVIIHLAAIVGFPACKQNPVLAKSVNVDGTRIIEQVRSKSQLIIFSSTGSNYGDLATEICTEETPLKPITGYGKTKTKAEEYLLQKENVIAYRFATGFGISPRLRLDLLVNDFVFQALKNRSLILYEKQFRRSFIHVSDMARAFIFAIENRDKMINNVFNVGDESMNYSKEEVALKIKEKIEYYLHFADVGTDEDKRNYYVSYKKINALGFNTTVTMDEGIDYLRRGFILLLNFRNRFSNV